MTASPSFFQEFCSKLLRELLAASQRGAPRPDWTEIYQRPYGVPPPELLRNGKPVMTPERVQYDLECIYVALLILDLTLLLFPFSSAEFAARHVEPAYRVGARVSLYPPPGSLGAILSERAKNCRRLYDALMRVDDSVHNASVHHRARQLFTYSSVHRSGAPSHDPSWLDPSWLLSLAAGYALVGLPDVARLFVHHAEVLLDIAEEAAVPHRSRPS